MPDLLVKLCECEDEQALQPDRQAQGILIRKPIGPEKQLLIDWVRTEFGSGWASEMDVALCNRPMSCFIAIKAETLIGFACYDAAALGYFGPIGILENNRGHGIGTALLLICLRDMRLKGYGYAIIGWAEAGEFYKKTVGAIEIPDGDGVPCIYKTMLRRPDRPGPADE